MQKKNALLAIPQHNPTNNTLATFFLAFLLSVGGQQLYAQYNPVKLWENHTDSMGCISSPHLVDLDNDNILDIVIGGGSDGQKRNNTICAYDGETGERMWGLYAWNQIYGSASFMDINNDGHKDALIGGRRGQLNAINGSTGELLWQFYPQGDTVDSQLDSIFNFYNPQPIPDQNNNGTPDILVANGGNHDIPSFDTLNRPVGKLYIVESQNGQIIATAKVPDGKETYCSAVVHDFLGNGNLEVIYGTGGETRSGNLWRVSLEAVRNEDLSSSIPIAFGTKGFIAPPTLADLNADGIKDIVANSFDGKTTAINGSTNQMMWQHILPGTETSAAVTVGRFTADYVPDVFVTVGEGVAPSYNRFIQVAMDGANGTVIWQDTIGIFQYTTGVAVDLNGDYRDELLTGVNVAENGVFKHNILAHDFANDTTYSVNGGGQPGTNFASTPWVGDMDGDEDLDMVYAHHVNSASFSEPPYAESGYKIERWNLGSVLPPNVAFGAYMGTHYTGIYDNHFDQCIDFNIDVSAQNVVCAGGNTGAISIHVNNGDAPYIYAVNTLTGPPLMSSIFIVQGRTADTYNISVTDEQGCGATSTVTITEPPAIVIDFQTTPPSPTQNGSATVMATGGVGAYTFAWSNGQTTNTLTAPQGNYTVTVTDANNCTKAATVGLYAVGINNQLPAEMLCYPNPARDRIWIKYEANTKFDIAIFDAVGRRVWESYNHIGMAQVPTYQLPKAYYTIIITTPQQTYQSQLMVTH